VFLPGDGGDRLGETVYWWDHETGQSTVVADDFDELRRR
jgi:hypothetical protein